eukprot:366167-Chlamydomonas_euryale.AAC.12
MRCKLGQAYRPGHALQARHLATGVPPSSFNEPGGQARRSAATCLAEYTLPRPQSPRFFCLAVLNGGWLSIVTLFRTTSTTPSTSPCALLGSSLRAARQHTRYRCVCGGRGMAWCVCMCGCE